MIELIRLGKLIPTIRYDGQDPSFQLQNISIRVRSLWAEYQTEVCTTDKCFGHDNSAPREYRDAAQAVALAYFAVANILLSLPETWANAQTPKTMETQHQAIIDSAAYLFEMKAPVSSASLPMFLPVTLVALYGFSAEQRDTASMLLNSELQHTVFKGLAIRAVNSIMLSDSGNLAL